MLEPTAYAEIRIKVTCLLLFNRQDGCSLWGKGAV